MSSVDSEVAVVHGFGFVEGVAGARGVVDPFANAWGLHSGDELRIYELRSVRLESIRVGRIGARGPPRSRDSRGHMRSVPGGTGISTIDARRHVGSA